MGQKAQSKTKGPQLRCGYLLHVLSKFALTPRNNIYSIHRSRFIAIQDEIHDFSAHHIFNNQPRHYHPVLVAIRIFTCAKIVINPMEINLSPMLANSNLPFIFDLNLNIQHTKFIPILSPFSLTLHSSYLALKTLIPFIASLPLPCGNQCIIVTSFSSPAKIFSHPKAKTENSLFHRLQRHIYCSACNFYGRSYCYK